ncbi:MAG: phytanoyl-CoA dioxygenase family protein [Chloroflexi bacterium]|nr:phytanoyl-CoA dioxygenase family protein [Chloroflexota bacterium]
MTAATDTLSDTIGTRQPFDLSERLAGTINELGMQPQIDQMRDEGYTVIPNIATPEFTARLRETCKRMTQETESGAKGYSAAMLLGRDPIYEEVVLNPKIRAIVEVMVGKGAMLSQLITSVRPEGAKKLTLHADQNWMPAPFPVHNYLLTMCWTMDEYTLEGGCTKVIPKTHRHKRHPNLEEVKAESGAIPIECPPNSLTCWDGSVWHGNYPRQIEGDRVVLHITFSRLALRPVENYDHLDEQWLEDKPRELSIMLGREDFLGTSTIARGFADYTKIPTTFSWAKT